MRETLRTSITRKDLNVQTNHWLEFSRRSPQHLTTPRFPHGTHWTRPGVARAQHHPRSESTPPGPPRYTRPGTTSINLQRTIQEGTSLSVEADNFLSLQSTVTVNLVFFERFYQRTPPEKQQQQHQQRTEKFQNNAKHKQQHGVQQQHRSEISWWSTIHKRYLVVSAKKNSRTIREIESERESGRMIKFNIRRYSLLGGGGKWFLEAIGNDTFGKENFMLECYLTYSLWHVMRYFLNGQMTICSGKEFGALLSAQIMRARLLHATCIRCAELPGFSPEFDDEVGRAIQSAVSQIKSHNVGTSFSKFDQKINLKSSFKFDIKVSEKIIGKTTKKKRFSSSPYSLAQDFSKMLLHRLRHWKIDRLFKLTLPLLKNSIIYVDPTSIVLATKHASDTLVS